MNESLWEQVKILGETIGRLASEVNAILPGKKPAANTSQDELKNHAHRFRQSGWEEDAKLVDLYAETRKQYAIARAAAEKSDKRDRKYGKVGTIEGYRPVSNGKWIGRVEPMPPSEPWHATTPPWEDKPTSEADTIPIRLTGNHSS